MFFDLVLRFLCVCHCILLFYVFSFFTMQLCVIHFTIQYNKLHNVRFTVFYCSMFFCFFTMQLFVIHFTIQYNKLHNIRFYRRQTRI